VIEVAPPIRRRDNRAMGITWDRRTRHIDRSVKPTRLGILRGRLLKAKVRARLGLPSRDLPGDLVVKSIALRAQSRCGSPQAKEALALLDQAILRHRLTERQRTKRDAARRRLRPGVASTKINLWRRRRDWLREAGVAMDAPGLDGFIGVLRDKSRRSASIDELTEAAAQGWAGRSR